VVGRISDLEQTGRDCAAWTPVHSPIVRRGPLALFGIALVLEWATVPLGAGGAVLAATVVEAVLRRRFFWFLIAVASLAALAAVGFASWLLVINWRAGVALVALVAAFAIGAGNLRSLLRRR